MAVMSNEGGPSKRYALRFISGKYQGGEFPLNPNREIVIGRSSELDMVLVEDMVSRKHAKISVSDDQIVIQDLGSTNGTFVNGERIKKTRLRENDRILVGTSILKLIEVDTSKGEQKEPLNEADLRSMMEKVAEARKTRNLTTMSGRIDEVPIPDLLQLFSTSKKNGVLVVSCRDREGRIYLRNGRVRYAAIDNHYEISPIKAFYRMVTWQEGFFELDSVSDEKFTSEINESTEGLLMEAMHEMDELKRIEAECPPITASYSLAPEITDPLRGLTAEQLDVLQLVHNWHTIRDVLDHSPLSDLKTYQAVLFLAKNDFIEESM
jgi:pSer/pThr/pTyr-binding forkhead associated (FHA) protein